MIKALKDKVFLKKFFSITFPVMLQTILAFIVSFVDNIMVGGVSNAAVSAVYAVNQASFFFFVVSFGIFSGASIYVQQFFGAKDVKHLKQAFLYKIVIGAALVLVMVPLLYVFGHHLVEFYSRSDTNQAAIIHEASLYMPLILISFVPFVFSMAYATTLRETEQTKLPLFVSMVALAINAGLNALFIYVFHMGVVGAALATIIARVVELVAIVAATHHRKTDFAYQAYKDFHIDPKLFRLITKKMIPLLINEIFWSTGMIMQSMSFAQRENVLSALSILNTTTEIFGIVFSGLAVGIGVMVGSQLGAGKIEEAKETTGKLIWLGILMSLSIGAIMGVLSPFIPRLWTEVSLSQQQLAMQMIIVYGAFLWVYSIAVSCYCILRAGGKANQTMIMDSGLMWVGTVPLAWILALTTSLPLVPMFAILQIIDIIKMFVGIYLVRRGHWANNLTVQVNEPAVISQVNDLLK